MYQDSGVQITTLKVDGGMTANKLLMQHQADVLGVPVIRPVVSETTVSGGRVRRRAGHRRVAGPRRAAGALAEGRRVDAADGARRSATASTATGARPCERSFGWQENGD